MMKRSIANRIAALALALVLAGSLVPGAWAAEGEPEGGGQLTGVTVTPSNLSMKVGERAYVEMRKHMAWYIRGIRGGAQLRARINLAPSADAMARLLGEFRDALAADPGEG